MRIYEIVIVPRHIIGDRGYYIMAEDFGDAYNQAQKLLAKVKKTTEDAYLESIIEQFELLVIN